VWHPGDKLVHPFNRELGTGIVRRVEGRFLTVWFPEAEADLTLAADGGGLQRLVLQPGARACILETDEVVEVAEALDHAYRLADGRTVQEAEIWPLAHPDTPVERLASLRLDPLDDFVNRLDGLRLASLREAGGLGSFLGGRIELFPHQLHTALRAVERDPVRWLLADEVGLGKTIEACLMLTALVRTGRAERVLVVAPSTLAIQWLGELWRKFHQTFVLLDAERVEAVASTVGPDANPFDVHAQAVVELEFLAENEALRAQAAEAGLDLVVLDEAHRLATREQHEALAPLVSAARHAVLLTATPLQADREGFYRLLSVLHPDAFSSFDDFDSAVERGDAQIPCTSAVRRADVGGLPSRVPMPVDVGPPDADLRRDPRVRWLVERVRAWTAAGEKALVFVHDLEELSRLRTYLESATQIRTAVFHEGMASAARDLEIAAFRETGLPVLLCSDAGSEGRNFQFCDRLVLWDLPFDPVVLEQRIGRLDRIGRQGDVEIVYFRHADAVPDRAAVFERLGLFERPAAGLDAALATVEPALRAAAERGEPLDVDALAERVEKSRADAGRDLARVFYPDAYDPSQDADLLARVPTTLEPLTQRVCVRGAQALGITVVDKGGTAMHYMELGPAMTIEGLPGVPENARYLGSFDRAEAVARDEVEFFAGGHPLVEGLLLELEDGNRGRAVFVDVEASFGEGRGLLGLFKDGPTWSARVVDLAGEKRPEWVEPLLAALPDGREAKPSEWGLGPSAGDALRALGDRLGDSGTLVAAALFRSTFKRVMRDQ
jgi:ATP-dependent helicase HepA